MRKNNSSSSFQTGPLRRRAAFVLGFFVVLQFSPVVIAPSPAFAFSSSWTFDAAGDYTVTANKIKVTSGQAQLARTPDWWNTDYAYRKRITVTAGSTAITTSNTITVKTDVDALITAGKVQNEADPDDLRIVYWNGSTNVNIDREYLSGGLDEALDSGTDQNDIRFKAQAAVSASGSDNGYYLYYGNAGATAGPKDPANVYQYYEPFSSDMFGGTPTWSKLNSARWSWSSGTGRLSHDTSNSVDEWSTYKNGNFDTTKSWYFEVTAKRTGGVTNATGFGLSNMTTNDVAPTLGWRMTTAPSGDVEMWKDGGSWIDNTGVGTVTITQNVDYRYTIRQMYSGDPTCDADWATGAAWVAGAKYNEAGVGLDRLSAANCPAAVNPEVYNYNATATFDDLKGWQYLNESIGLSSEEPTYPTDDPTVTPTTAVTFDRLDSFAETSTLNGGSIRYVLSNDGGTTWLYHNGTTWTTSDATYAQATSAANINTNAATFPMGSRSLLWRAFLRSDGTQLVQLDTVSLNGNRRPNQPSLTSPSNGSTTSTVTPTVTLTSTDDDSDGLRYVLQVDTANTFNTGNLTTYNQATSQSGWSGQDALSGTGYASGTSASFTFPSALNAGQTYYWRVQSVDPNGVNTASTYSATGSFVAPGALTPTGIQASTITTSSAIILWTTSNAATSTVEYGTTTAYGSTAAPSGTRTSHQVALSSLAPSTTYHYRVSGSDGTGQTYQSADQTFTTLGPTVITNVVATPLTSRSIRITWTTNHAADSKVRYGTSTAYGSEVYDATLVTSHSLTLTGLEPNATYHYEVLSVGNTSTNDADATASSLLSVPTILEPIADVTFAASQRVRVVGLAGSGQTVGIYVDGELDGTTTARTTSTGTGDFAYTVKRSLSLGTHTLQVKATTSANSSLVGEVRSFTVISASTAPTLLPPLVTDGGQMSVTIRGLAPSGAKIVLSLNGRKLATVYARTTSTGTGDFKYTLQTKDLAAGLYTVTAVAYNESDVPSKAKTGATFRVTSAGAVVPQTTLGFTHVVKGGESLWSLAEEFYGDGRKYTKLVTANVKTYPSLSSNPSLVLPGWVLVVPK